MGVSVCPAKLDNGVSTMLQTIHTTLLRMMQKVFLHYHGHPRKGATIIEHVLFSKDE